MKTIPKFGVWALNLVCFCVYWWIGVFALYFCVGIFDAVLEQNTIVPEMWTYLVLPLTFLTLIRKRLFYFGHWHFNDNSDILKKYED